METGVGFVILSASVVWNLVEISVTLVVVLVDLTLVWVEGLMDSLLVFSMAPGWFI